MDEALLKGYLQIKCSNPGRIARKAWRKRWLVIEFPTCNSDEVRSSSILVRVYVSHHHENKGPPAFCIPILDVHGLHRIQSRSQPYAFSIDGSSGELVAAGVSETETQGWMYDIRTRIWDTHPLLLIRQDTGYTIALIDNVHSDIARLRGFYGIVHVDSEEGELVLTEARSGEEQARWRISSINRTFCPKTVCKKDKNKILVIITHRNKSNGEGIFTFYSEDAKAILRDFKNANFLKNKSSDIPCEDSIKGKDSGNKTRKNPLSFLFKRDSSQVTQVTKSNNCKTSKQEKGRRKVLEKSASMMENFRYDNKNKIPQIPAMESIKEKRKEKRATKSSSLTRQKQEDTNMEKSYYSCDEYRSTDTPSPPPYPSPPENNIKDILKTGDYYSFDKVNSYEPLGKDNSDHETIAELQNIEKSLYELSQRQYDTINVRNSYLSVDSGRTSDTYETSNSSVTSSSTNHSNRLNSNASNCSGDSGTQLSIGSSEYSNRENILQPLQEKDSPDYDQKLQYQHSDQIDIPATINCSLRECLQENRIYCCTSNTCGNEGLIYEQIYNRSQNPAQRRDSVSTRNASPQRSDPETPPPLPPRYATIRKSYTLPINMAGSAENRNKDHTNNVKEIEGSRQGSLPKRSSINRHSMNIPENAIRPRPSSLSVDKRQFLRSVSQENPANRTLNMSTFSSNKPVKQTSCMPVPFSMPTTPNESYTVGSEYQTVLGSSETPTKRSRSLQRGAERIRSLSNTQPVQLRKWGLSNSTPHDLDNSLMYYRGRFNTWKSNDGLTTPVSFDGCSPYQTPLDSPADSPQIQSKFHKTSLGRVPLKMAGFRKSSLRGSDSMFSLNFSSPRKVTTAVFHNPLLSTQRFHSIPRSCTTDGLSGSHKDRMIDHKGQSSGNQTPSRYIRQTGLPGFATSPIIPFCQPTSELVEASQRRNFQFCRQRHKTFGSQSVDSTLERVKETSPLFVGNSKSLENLINEAKQELVEERQARERTNSETCEEIYIDMSHRNKPGPVSDYLEMEKLQQFQDTTK